VHKNYGDRILERPVDVRDYEEELCKLMDVEGPAIAENLLSEWEGVPHEEIGMFLQFSVTPQSMSQFRTTLLTRDDKSY
jgi:hypothetical protein